MILHGNQDKILIIFKSSYCICYPLLSFLYIVLIIKYECSLGELYFIVEVTMRKIDFYHVSFFHADQPARVVRNSSKTKLQ